VNLPLRAFAQALGSSVLTLSPARISSSSVSRSTPTAGVTISATPAARAEHGRAGEQRFDRRQAERLVPLRGIQRQRARASSTALRLPSTSPT